MRVKQLRLERFGRFYGQEITFGSANDQDFHLIYGPNEAGKSTIFAAMEDLFFGISNKSKYAFKFEQALLRVAAQIEADGAVREIARIVDKKAALTDHLNAPLPESVFGPELERMDRQAYRAMFSLNEASLRAGGRDILDAKGDVAEILFGASLGLAAVSERLRAMREEAESLFAPASPSKRLYKLRADLKEVRERQKAADLNAAAFDKLQTTRDVTDAADKEANAKRQAAWRTLERLRRLDGALQNFADYRDDAPKLADLGGLPSPPAHMAERATALQAAEAELRTRAMTAEQRLEGLQREIDKLPADAPALAALDRMEALEGLAGKHRGALESIPNRLQDIAELSREVDAVTARLGDGRDRPPEAYRLPPDVLAELDGLAGEFILLDAKAKTSETELENAREAAVAGVNLTPETRAQLKGALEQTNKGDPESDLRRTEDALADASESLADALADLAPWRGDADALAAQETPSAQEIEDWRARALAIASDAADLRSRREAAQDARHARQIADAGAALPPGVDDAAFGDMRDARDALWREHLARLDAESADAFWRKANEVDAAGDARLANADALAAARRAEAEDAREALELAKLDAAAADNVATQAALDEEVTAAATALGLPDRTIPPEALARWLALRETALNERKRRSAARRAVEAARTHLDALGEALRQALHAAGVDVSAQADLPTLRALAADASEKARAGAEAAQAIERRQKQHDDALAALAQWRERWTAAIQGSWLEETGAGAAFLRAAQHDLNRLREKLDVITDLRSRIRQMEQDKADFAAIADELAATLHLAPNAGDPLALAAAIRERAQAAVKNDALRRQLEEQRDREIETLNACAAEKTILGGEVDEILSFLNVADLKQAQETFARIEMRDRLEAAQERRASALIRATGAETIAAALEAFEGRSETDLAVEIKEAETLAEALETEALEANAAAREAAKAFEQASGDADAALLEQERQTKLLEIEQETRRYLRLKFGVAAAERAMAHYRDKHRSAMLEKASAAFARITRGSFRRLETQLVGGKETLLAIRADGAAPIKDFEMSEGTRAQLYLALRIAAYFDFEGSPPPFVADDILETFDDDRAAETFQALTEMSGRGQVIYLTHHAHLIDIFRRVAPSATVHRLPDPLSTAAQAP